MIDYFEIFQREVFLIFFFYCSSLRGDILLKELTKKTMSSESTAGHSVEMDNFLSYLRNGLCDQKSDVNFYIINKNILSLYFCNAMSFSFSFFISIILGFFKLIIKSFLQSFSFFIKPVFLFKLLDKLFSSLYLCRLTTTMIFSQVVLTTKLLLAMFTFQREQINRFLTLYFLFSKSTIFRIILLGY